MDDETHKHIPASTSNSPWLEGQLLIATPQLIGSCFEKAVIYLCAHNQEGAMGLILNQPIHTIKAKDIFKQLNIHIPNQTHEPNIYFGGPVDTARGFVLHSDDYKTKDSMALPNQLAMTCTIDILKDIASGIGPKQYLMALGYAGWAAGQLETELETNSWITSPATVNFIFNTAPSGKWIKSAAMGGIDLMKLSGDIGHA